MTLSQAWSTPGPSNVMPTATARSPAWCAALPSGLVWLALGASLHRLLHRGRAARIFNLALAASPAAAIAPILW